MLRPLKSTLLRIDWPSHKRIPDVAVPILFISGDKVFTTFLPICVAIFCRSDWLELFGL